MHSLQASALRIAAIGCTSRPVLYTSLSTSLSHNYSTIVRPSTRTPHAWAQSKHHVKPLTFNRRASTTVSTTADAASSSSSTSTTSTPPKLTWNAFLQLRKLRRRYNLLASFTTATATTITGMAVLAQQNFEQLSNVMFGLDPIFAIGLCTTACTGVGWLVGPVAGGWAFKLRHKGQMSSISLKEREFFERIKKYRVDPSTSSVSNPVPDYYGEKITSVSAYRQWLKDQRAFNRKRQSYV